ncbi:MAG: NAD(P)-dependent alcohol dehydrogenase [Armatimonadota bacterium]|jgi:L-iditol 2-dehydrogenase
MSDTMKAAVLHGVEDLRIDDVPVPSLPSPHDVIVRIQQVGVCGSDIHYFRHGRIAHFVVQEPMILGHECAGEVVEVGDEVTTLKQGDRVALEPGVPCRRCEFCHEGKYNLCADVVFFATPPVDGAFCEYVASPADFAYKLPDNVSAEEGAMMEPLAVGMWSTHRARVGAGDSVAILGAGPIGLVTLQAARARGATTLIISDVEQPRLDFAGKLGATHALNARECDVVEAVKEITGGRGTDSVLEAAGTVETLNQALKAVKTGGRVIVIGAPPQDEAPISIPDLILRELDIGGIFRYANMYPRAVAAVAAGRIDVKSMITHHYALPETREALVFADENKSECLKVAVSVE